MLRICQKYYIAKEEHHETNISIYYTHETELYAESYDALNRSISCKKLRDLEKSGEGKKVNHCAWIWIGPVLELGDGRSSPEQGRSPGKTEERAGGEEARGGGAGDGEEAPGHGGGEARRHAGGLGRRRTRRTAAGVGGLARGGAGLRRRRKKERASGGGIPRARVGPAQAWRAGGRGGRRGTRGGRGVAAGRRRLRPAAPEGDF